MKKVIIYTLIVILTIIIVGVIVVETSIIRVQLPHGAVLHVLPAPRDNHTHGAVILCPGGGYGKLGKWHEGYLWFPFFHRQGFTVAMLEYRLPNHDHQVPMVDGFEAVQLMRLRAGEWGFDKCNVGVMGFSAGGHLASTLMVSDRVSVRPDFGILFYPVISMKNELAHQDSYVHLLGEKPSEELEDWYSNELHVSSQTPPAYIALSSDDPEVNPQNSIRFQEKMRAKNRPVVLHVYPSGGHGWGYRLSFPYHRLMLDDLTDWLKTFRK
jgi:acetyl esterase/lipase